MKIKDIEFANSLEDIISELRSQLSANRLDLLKKDPVVSGHNIQCQCIYHANGQERRPSMGIDMNTGIVHCFACGTVKDLPEFISDCFNKNDSGAFGWNWLIKNFVSIEAGGDRNVKLNIVRDNSNRAGSDNNLTYISEDILDSYRYYHPYWEKRGIVDEDIIELFDLGFDEETNCITFPVRDVTGGCLFVAKRNIYTKFFNYPQGVKKPLYGLYELSRMIFLNCEGRNPDRDKVVIITESMIDCILLWQEGYISLALNGLGNNLQMKQLDELPFRALVVATDNDDAGWDAYYRIKERVNDKIIYRAIFPKGRKDIGEMTKEEIQHIKWQL